MSGPCCRTPKLGEEPEYSEHLARLIAGVIGRAQTNGDAPIVVGRDIVELAAVKALVVAPAVQAEKPGADEDTGTDEYAEALRWFRDRKQLAVLSIMGDSGLDCYRHAATIVRAALAGARPAVAEPTRCRCGVRSGQRHMRNCPRRCWDCGGDPDGPNACGCAVAASPRAGADTCSAKCSEMHTFVWGECAAAVRPSTGATDALRDAGDTLASRVQAMFAAERPTLWHRHRDHVESAVEAWRALAQPSAEQDGDLR